MFGRFSFPLLCRNSGRWPAIFAWRQQIWFLMVAHAAFDFTALAIIYWGWERTLAHLLFR